MSEALNAIRVVVPKLVKAARANWCERFIGWALAVCPEEYTPSFVEAVVKGYEDGYRAGLEARGK
jgi:hypothetical protein